MFCVFNNGPCITRWAWGDGMWPAWCGRWQVHCSQPPPPPRCRCLFVAVDCRRLHVSCYHLTILVRTSRQMSSSQLVMWVPIRSRLANSVLTSLTNMLTDMWATLTDTIIDIFCSSPSLNSVLHSLLQLVTSNITILMWLLLLLITLLYWCEFCY